MNKNYSKYIIISIIVSFMTACVNGQDKESKSNTANSAKESLSPDMSMAWLGNGAQILINGQLLFDLQAKTFKHLNFIKSSSQQLVAYPNGYSMFRFTGQDQLDIFDIKQASGISIKIPTWVTGNKESGEENTIVNIPAWLDEKKLYVYQFFKQAPNIMACGVYELDNSRWLNLNKDNCLETSFFSISKIYSFGNGLVATVSYAEGQQALDFFQLKLDGKKVQQKLVAMLNIAFSPMQIQRTSDSNYSVVVPCVLTSTMPMECEPQKTQSWSVYDLYPQSKKLQARYKTLPQAVYAAPNSDTLAWIGNNKLCIGKPSQKDAECVEP